MGEVLFPKSIQDTKTYFVLGDIKIGESFGEQSALTDELCPFTVEITSNTADAYKIHRSNFIRHFGGSEGAPAVCLLAMILLKRNWMNMKADLIKKMT